MPKVKYLNTEEELRALPIDKTGKRLSNKYKVIQIQSSDAIDCMLLNFYILDNKNREIGAIHENFEDDGDDSDGFFKSRGSENFYKVHLESKDPWDENIEYEPFNTLQLALDYMIKKLQNR